MELLAHGDTVFDILDGRACEDARKKLLLAQEEPGRGKGSAGISQMLWSESQGQPCWEQSP